MSASLVKTSGTRTMTTAEQSEKLMKARCRLMTREPWYGHCAMSMTWISSSMSWLPEERRTMGVRIVNGGEIQCLYYPTFVDSMTVKETFAVIQHEIEHIVRVHCLRVEGRDPDGWNIAADMTVNGPRHKPRIGYRESSSEVIVPLKGNIIWIPEDWPQDASAEVYYAMLEKRQLAIAKPCKNCGRAPGCKKKSGSGKGDKDEPGQGGPGSCPTCGQSATGEYSYGGVSGKAIDDHSIWNQSDVSQDEARQVVKDMVEQASSKAQGNTPGHLLEAIKELAKPVVRWRELLRHYLGKHVGNQRQTFSRRNRRHDAFGVPGVSHHAAATVNVIVDTSGSIGSRELGRFFAEIDAISSRAKVNVLQWDHAFQGWATYRTHDWKKFKVSGRGGTDMAAPIQWLIDNRLVADVQIMLTDGHCNWHTEEAFPMITVITTPEGSTTGPGWGHEIRLKND